MHSSSVFVKDGLANRIANSGSAVLLASPDMSLILDLQRVFKSLGLSVETATDGESATAAMRLLDGSAILLLDTQLGGLANGQLLAAIHESGLHKRCAIALIAEQVSDEWIARLREGAIDDIVPRNADAATWTTHLSTMQRGHRLYCELEQMREAALTEVQRDLVTGAFNRETMLTVLFRETDRVQRLRSSMCLVLFDIDDFGHWNDALGRQACDDLLRETAARTNRILRSYDLLGRTGSDEFLLVLPGCSLINAVMMAERLRMDVFGEPFPVKIAPAEVKHVKLTACFGITASHGRSPVVVLREAEQTLAQGKHLGPDAIRCASESPLSAESAASVATLFPELTPEMIAMHGQ
jgi:diguanylate cyclase (GGDEF)-like protein